MSRVLVCLHCGRRVEIEPVADTDGTRLLAHLLGWHCDVLLPGVELPRLARLLEHFREV